ncbi:hypothetical protein ABI214_07945 [Prescottella soli]|uniref:Uncharacterized protein n=1 Tax=Prescottella soli TaxID=1543852 RepID=A0ABW9FNQ6_9NOCA
MIRAVVDIPEPARDARTRPGTPPPLPVRDAGTDHQLHDFARECAARYTAAKGRDTAAANPIGAAIREYRDSLAALDTDRVHNATTAAFCADLANDITGNRSVWRLSRLLRRAASADVDPVNMLRWHGQRITDNDNDITALDSLTGPRPANGEAAADSLAIERRRAEYERARSSSEQAAESNRRRIDPVTKPEEPNLGPRRRI